MHPYLIQHFFQRVASRDSDNKIFGNQANQLSYQELEIFTNKLAWCLIHSGVNRNNRIACYMERTVLSIAAFLGVLKADAAYVPIDFSTPKERLYEILINCSPKMVITDMAGLTKLYPILTVINLKPSILVIDADTLCDEQKVTYLCLKDIEQEEAKQLAYRNIDRDIAYIIYTSGSTGTPKGVMVSHANVSNYINWAIDYFKISKNDTILSTSPFHLDVSVFDIYCSLFSGANLVIANNSACIFPSKLINLVEHYKVSIWKASASILSYLVKTKSLSASSMLTLQKIIFSGEPLPAKYLMEWMKIYPKKEFYNAYGPTECTGISTCYKVTEIPTDENLNIPIGKARENCEILVLSSNKKRATVGEVGQLCIRSSSMSQGYLNDDKKTNLVFEKFGCDSVYMTGDYVKKRADGNYVFVGRKDSQVSIQGYRIELGEIEHALRKIAGIVDAACISKDNDNTTIIVAYIEIDGVYNVQQMKNELREFLPTYMIPAEIYTLECLPKLSNGKIDRVNLREISSVSHLSNVPDVDKLLFLNNK